MKRRVAMISVLLLIPMLVNWAIRFLPDDVDLDMTWSLLYVAVFFAVAHAQAVLLAIWAGFARGPLPWRLSAMIAGIALCSIPRCLTGSLDFLSTHVADQTESESAGVVYILAVLLVVRCFGVGLELHSNRVSHQDSNAAKSRHQFSLRYLFWWTTGLALLLAMVRCIALCIADTEYPYEFSVSYWQGLTIPVCFALIVLVAVWTVLGSRRPILRVILLASVVAAAGVASGLTGSASFGLVEWCVMVTSFYLPFAAWITGSLIVFRVVGYRIVWRRPMWWVAGTKRSGAPEREDS
ncbi:MAG: hypothetical protein HQ567_26490 [Candidatus Nealsonbacteria bacterium]|nr:hypothetical protein [Candidatus Nealsonbacteria bacterium]